MSSVTSPNSGYSFVHLIRHGKPASSWGDHGADPDPGLDADGLAQAEAAAAVLLALPPEQRPVRVISSPLRRCRETAQPLASALGVEVIIEPAVAEIPTPVALAAETRPTWLRNAFGGRWDEIEGDLDYSAWAEAVATACIRHPGAAIFSHFVAINAAVAQAVGDPRVRQFEPGHASITTFSIASTGLQLLSKGVSATTQVL
jgi:broad specificity phosphatase PhoE